MSWLDDAYEEIARLTPVSGFNVVAVDSFEPAGEALYFVGHYEDEAAAKAAAAEHQARTGDKAHVYRPAAT